MHAPIPPELLAEDKREMREIYYEELRKKIRVLLEKSLRTHEQNLLMLERLGVENEWRDKSKLAFAKLQRMLDPTFKFEFADPTSAGKPPAEPPPPPPPAPTAPAERPGATPDQPADAPEPEHRERPPEIGPQRQIL